MKNPISPIILNKTPEFLKTEYRQFYKFLCDYFQFLENERNPLEILESFYEKTDLFNDSGFFEMGIAELGFDIERSLSIPKTHLIVHLRDFYLNRGNVRSFKILFKLLFNENVEIDYPRKRLFLLSRATFSDRKFVYLTTNSFGTKQYFSVLQSSANDLSLSGLLSRATCNVEQISIEHSNNRSYIKVEIDDPTKAFTEKEAVRLTNHFTGVSIVETIVPLIGVDVVSRGRGYRPGDPITISGCSLYGSAVIDKVQKRSVKRLEVTNSGTNYQVGDRILSSPPGVSGEVSAIDLSLSRISVPKSSWFNIESSDFTVEFNIKRQRAFVEETIIGNQTPTSGWAVSVSPNNKIVFEFKNRFKIETRFSIQRDREHHIAIVKSGVTVSIFVDGILVKSDTFNGSGLVSPSDLIVGAPGIFIGNLWNIRITKAARYVSNFSEIQLDHQTDPLKALTGLFIKDSISDLSDQNHQLTASSNVVVESNKLLFVGSGPITSVSVFSGGYNFSVIPRIYIDSKTGIGAELSVIETDIGAIKSVAISEAFGDFGQINEVQVNIVSPGHDGAVGVKTSLIFVEPAKFRNSVGFLEQNCILQDSYYFQQFSYEIISGVTEYDHLQFVDELLHPTGFVKFINQLTEINEVIPGLFDNFSYNFVQNKIYYLSDLDVEMFGGSQVEISDESSIGGNSRSMSINNLNWMKDFDFVHPNQFFEQYSIVDLDLAIPMSETVDPELIIT